MPADSPDPLIGQCLGNYRLTETLGFGSMGHVYLAQHDLMGRRAAIKVLNEELSANGAVVERFLNEARAVNDIRHPHVVEITDFGQVDGRYYLIMELLEGETLASLLDQVGALPPEQAVRIGIQIASALQAAHARGIVHRDLKPENIFLITHEDYPNYVKILDFGVAKLIGKRGASTTRTELGALLGTPHYMSPEQCLGDREVGPESDVYSLGIVLYEMVTGELPFDAQNLSQLLLAQVNAEPPPPSRHVPGLPGYLDAAILKAMSKRPEARFGSMHALRGALLREPLPSDAPPAGPNAMGEAPATAPEEPPGTPQAPVATQAQDRATLDPRTNRTRKGLGAAATLVAPRAPRPLVPEEDLDDAHGLSDGDEARSQRVANKLARIILERVQSQNLVLPTMPQVAVECMRQLADDRITFGNLAGTLEKDPLLATQVLRVANSVAFASAEKARSLDQAVSRLGGRQLRTLLIELSAHQVFQSREKRIRDAFDGIWEHSLAVALLSRAICRAVGQGDPELAHLSGLLHDLGKPMVGSMLLEAERRLSTREERFMTPGLWMQVVEDSHRDVGTAIVRAWKMPDELVETVKTCGILDRARPFSVVNYVTVANALAEASGYRVGSAGAGDQARVLEEGLGMLDLTERADELLDSLATHVSARGRPQDRAS